MLLIALVACKDIHASQIVVSQSKGSDESGDGSVQKPFKTIKKAVPFLEVGDTCIIREGVYREEVKFEGRSDLTFMSSPDEYVLITGLELVSDWKKHEGNIYTSKFEFTPDEMDFPQLFMKGKLQTFARYPNFSHIFDVESGWSKVKILKNDKNAYFLDDPDFPENHWDGGIVRLAVGSRWCISSGIIDGNTRNTVHCERRSDYWKNNRDCATGYANDGGEGNPEERAGGAGFGYITNHYNAMDIPGEWHWQSDSLFFYAPEGTNPNKIKMEARKRRWAVSMKNCDNIKFIGLNFKAASLQAEECNNILIDSCSFRYLTPYMEVVDGRLYTEQDAKGIYLKGNYNKVVNTYIKYSWGDGITIEGDQCLVDNSVIEETNWIGDYSCAIHLSGRNSEVRNSNIGYTGGAAIHHGGLRDGKILNNHFYETGFILEDVVGANYAYRTDGEGTEIAYNWSHGVHDKRLGPAYYIDNMGRNFIIHHNVAWDAKAGIRVNLWADNVDVFNNTFWDVDIAMISWGQDKPDKRWNWFNTKSEIYNNLTNSTEFSYQDTATYRNTLSFKDPESLFMNAAQNDYRLKPNSRAIDYGKEIHGITEGYMGSAPDAGAYESGGVFWVPGSTLEIPLFEDEGDFKDVPANLNDLVAIPANRNQIDLFWTDNSNSASSYLIINEGDEVANIPASFKKYSVTGLKEDTNYQVSVTPVNQSGKGKPLTLPVKTPKSTMFDNKKDLWNSGLDIQENINLFISPYHFRDEFTIHLWKLRPKEMDVKIFDVEGSLVFEKFKHHMNLPLKGLDDLPLGYYLLQVRDGFRVMNRKVEKILK